MKTALIALFALSLGGCGVADRWTGAVTGFARTCVDGVLYYQFTSGAAVAYSPDGKIKLCK